MLKITLILLIGLVVLGVISLMVDYYFYSWTSFVRPFGCEYKNIRVVYKHEKLEQEYDLTQIKNNIKSNPNYQIELPYSGELQNESTLKISRMFGNVKYNIGLWKHTRPDEKFTRVEFDNFGSDFRNNAPSPTGEQPSTPNHYIENNIYQMIDEMPLTDAQKSELKAKVQIGCSPKTKIGF